jgi:hypothetical protein
VFSKPQIEQALEKFATVRLNTWGRFPTQVPSPDDAAALRSDKLKNNALPYYVVVRVRGSTLTRIGSIAQGVVTEAEMATFLREVQRVR